MKKRILISISLMFGVLFLSGFGCKKTVPKEYSINLEIWGIFDSADVYADIFSAYKDTNPNIGEIVYRKMNQETFQEDLIRAMAAGQGPDIFMMHNRWTPSFADKIYPAPSEILGEQKFRKDFVDTVVDDFMFNGTIYAVPLSVDSLGLYYNKDLFNEAGITSPPKNWEEFMEDARKMTKIDINGQIVQSGAAMGTASNINRATDVLNLLMLQNKTEMVDLGSMQASFNNRTNQGSDVFSPGENALNFYTQFANQNSSSIPYTWNPKLHYSIDAFSEGTLGMMFNYSWQMDTLAYKAPKLNYAVAPVPQFPGGEINIANYWGYAVAKDRKPSVPENDPASAKKVNNDIRAREAWKFLAFMATKSEQAVVVTKNVAGSTQVTNSDFDAAANYLEKTRKPAARRDLIEKQKTDPRIGFFAEGNLIAKSWYQIDSNAIEALFAQMIEKINSGESSVRDAIDYAAENVSLLMKRE